MTTDGDRTRRRWKLGARVAMRKLWARTVEVLTEEPSRSDGRAAERAGAEAMATEAGELRGGVAKLAQMTAYFAGPDAAVDAASRERLGSLWDDLPPMDAQAARRVVEQELGAPVGERFSRWDDRPLAAASIGQVHAAATGDGRELAVKVQYPEVADALRSDLGSARLARRLAGAGGPLSADAIEAVRRAIVRELDYRAEADAIARFRAAFAGDGEIVIPEVDEARSGARVLSMERLRGAPLAEVARAGNAPLRREAARVLFRFAWEAPLRHGLVNADPNPGNYLVLPGDPPRVGFVDFGCTERLPDAVRDAERTLWGAILAGDPFEAAERFRGALADRGMVRSARVLHGELYRTWEQALVEPFVARGPSRWTPARASRLAETTGKLLLAGDLVLPADTVLLWRQRLGVSAVLASLDADLPYRALLREAVAAPV